jgi:hypothetical protein
VSRAPPHRRHSRRPGREAKPTSLDEKLQNAEPEVITAAERLRFPGEEIGLPIRSTPASLRLTDSLGSVVLLYPTYRTVKSPNVGVREALKHWDTVAEIIRTLVRIRANNTPPPDA